MYEHKNHRLLSRAEFYIRIAQHIGISLVLLAISLGMGMIGYVFTEEMPWIDAFLNASMLLGGMGQVDPPKTFGGKLFSGAFALYAGLLFVICAAVVLTPVIHRVLHQFHVSEKE